jgi:hypothetical protein
MINQISKIELESPITFYLEKFKGEVPSEFKAAYDASLDIICSTSIPIVAEINRRHEIIATGFILSMAQKFFFVTAAHVTDDRGKYAIGISDSYSEGTSSLFNLQPPFFSSITGRSGSRNDDNSDFSVVEIESSIALKLAQSRRLLSQDNTADIAPAPNAWRALPDTQENKNLTMGRLGLDVI